MKTKHVIILVSTLLIGMIIGGTIVGIYSHHKMKSITEQPTIEKFRQKTIHMLDPDDAQLKQIEPIIKSFSEKAYNYEKDNHIRIYVSYDSLYTELKPFLNDRQKQKFEKKLNHIKTEVGK